MATGCVSADRILGPDQQQQQQLLFAITGLLLRQHLLDPHNTLAGAAQRVVGPHRVPAGEHGLVVQLRDEPLVEVAQAVDQLAVAGLDLVGPALVGQGDLGLVDLAPVEVDESVTAPGGGQRRVDAVVEPLGRVERRAAQGGVRQARAVEVAGADHGGTQAGGVSAFEHRRVRLPRLRIRPVLPRQLVEHAPRRGVDDEVAGQAVRAGGQAGAERAHRRRRRRRARAGPDRPGRPWLSGRGR